MRSSPTRRRRVAVGLAAAGALLLAADPAGAKAPARPLGTIYAGTTSKTAPFVLTLGRNGRLRAVNLYADTACDDGGQFLYVKRGRFAAKPPSTPVVGGATLSPSTVSRTGTFNATGIGNETDIDGNLAGAVILLHGKLTPAGGSGTLSVQLTSLNADGSVRYQCDSGPLRWKAASRAGRAFGGMTSDGMPVVLQLDPAATRVAHFTVGWETACRPSGGFAHFATDLIDYTIADGAFGDTFTDGPDDMGNGVTRTVTITLSGRVAAHSASGTFRLSGTDVSATGDPPDDTCDTGPLSWNALSS
jgi:hypothetical protein